MIAGQTILRTICPVRYVIVISVLLLVVVAAMTVAAAYTITQLDAVSFANGSGISSDPDAIITGECRKHAI